MNLLSIGQYGLLMYNWRVVTKRPETKEALAAEVWRRIFDFILSTHDQRDRVLERFGLTPGDSKALVHLQPDAGQSMGSLAAAWSCDASNATWMVDRLEERALVERRPVPGDRRVKAVVLTAKGLEMKAALLEALYEPPDSLLAIPTADLEALRNALEKLPEVSDAGPTRARPAED